MQFSRQKLVFLQFKKQKSLASNVLDVLIPRYSAKIYRHWRKIFKFYVPPEYVVLIESQPESRFVGMDNYAVIPKLQLPNVFEKLTTDLL